MIYISNLIILLAIKGGNKFEEVFFKAKNSVKWKNFKNNFTKQTNFNFIQIGANDGVSFDFYMILYSKKIICSRTSFRLFQLEFNYRDFTNIIKVNKAVHPIDKQVFDYKISVHWLNILNACRLLHLTVNIIKTQN
jgi:hypothetical protein